jgi:hypothetical protein
VPRRRDEVDAEALDVVIRVQQRRDLPVAAVARTGVEMADVERSAEPAVDPHPDVLLGRRIGQQGLDADTRRKVRRFHRVDQGVALADASSTREVIEIASFGQARTQAAQKMHLPASIDSTAPDVHLIAPVGHDSTHAPSFSQRIGRSGADRGWRPASRGAAAGYFETVHRIPQRSDQSADEVEWHVSGPCRRSRARSSC